MTDKQIASCSEPQSPEWATPPGIAEMTNRPDFAPFWYRALVAPPTTKNPLPSTNAVPGKVSEMILDFARPLLDVMGSPGAIDDLRSAFELVTVCWNLPIFEREQRVDAKALRPHFDAMVAGSPKPLSSALLGLVEARTTAFAQVPFLVVVEVRGTSLDDCTVYVEARGGDGGQLLKRPS